MKHRLKITVCILLLFLITGYFTKFVYTHPYVGVMVTQNNEGQIIVSESSPQKYWGFGKIYTGDQIVEVNGQPAQDYYPIRMFDSLEQASSIALDRTGPDGVVKRVTFEVSPQLPRNELLTHLIFPWLALLMFSGLSIVIYRRKKSDPAAIQLILFFLSIGLAYFSSFSSGRANPVGMIILYFSMSSVPIFFIQFLKLYLESYQEMLTGRFTMRIFYLLIAAINVIEITRVFYRSRLGDYNSGLMLFYFAGINIYIVIRLIQKFALHRKQNSPMRSLFKFILIGHVSGFAPFIFLFAIPQLFGMAFMSAEISAIFLLIIPFVYLYMFTTKQLFDVDFLLSRFFYYAGIAFFPTIAISVLASLLLTQHNQFWVRWGQLFLVSYLLIILMLFLKEYADLKLRPSLNKDMHNFQGSLGRFSARISRVMKLTDLERVLEQEIYQVLPVKKAVFVTVDTNRLQELTLSEPLDGIRNSLIAAIQSAVGKLDVGTIFSLQRGIGVVAGKKLNRLHILWLDDKGSRTKYNLDELAWLRTLANYSAIVYENLYLVESLVEELEAEFRKKNGNASSPWLSRLIFTLSEKERRKLASDLHDSALQDQLIWYRNLESAMLDHEMGPELHQKLDNIKEGLLDVIHQIRETCNELRPPLLQEMGIVEALRGLFEQAQIRSDFVVDFHPGTFTADINDDQLLTLYRIVQELLRNASKHAKASTIRIALGQEGNHDILLTYKDNGIGLKLEELQDSYHHMGLSGIKERVNSLEGDITFKSAPGQGLEVRIILPLDSARLSQEA
ncbi:Sensor histidine kinase ComP [Paenibacillus auburnensis]|uniref:histidine kinase n=1 Tax=Paenibacillus auburnensis TaxID=2905649 RepID=A0ABN8GWL0_9BACL|nr:sensor histidine kinase [Paenibacillus auburnensis]CAH1220536.1 Sensor histidine kinase ComP [Paenibacillus auburnensis]